MRKVLALLIVGTSMAVAAGVAFAGEAGKDSVDHQFSRAAVTRANVTPAVGIRAEATNTGAIAGPSTPRCV